MKNEIKKLVGWRFSTLKEIEDKIKSVVGKEIAISDCPTDTLSDTEDYRIFWDCDEIGGTIWYALTRANQIYITEVNFD